MAFKSVLLPQSLGPQCPLWKWLYPPWVATWRPECSIWIRVSQKHWISLNNRKSEKPSNLWISICHGTLEVLQKGCFYSNVFPEVQAAKAITSSSLKMQPPEDVWQGGYIDVTWESGEIGWNSGTWWLTILYSLWSFQPHQITSNNCLVLCPTNNPYQFPYEPCVVEQCQCLTSGLLQGTIRNKATKLSVYKKPSQQRTTEHNGTIQSSKHRKTTIKINVEDMQDALQVLKLFLFNEF